MKKQIINKSWLYIFSIVSLIILTIPRSISTVWPNFYSLINIIKVLVVLLTIMIIVINKVKISKFTKITIIYSLFLFLTTIVNHVNPVTFMKVYFLNVGILFLSDIIFAHDYKNKVISFLGNYFLILLSFNLILIFVGFLLGSPFGMIQNTYLLGQDNRFILYIIPTLICFYYLYIKQKLNYYKYRLYLSYFIGLVSLGILWSASAMVILIFVGIGYFVLTNNKKINLNIKAITLILFIASILIVFFRIQNLFKFLIVDILHKSLTLSYRTIIWDDAFKMFLDAPSHIIYGFGYFDTTTIFPSLPFKVNHLHNLLMNNLFFGGIIGSCIYYYNIYNIEKNICKINNKQNRNIITLLFLALIALMIFDTFELYQIYYFILYLFYISTDLLNTKIVFSMSKKEQELLRSKNSKVGILLATYNGEKYIKEQIDSIINQTYENWILYISDDNSTDDTLKIIDGYIKNNPNRIVLLKHKEKFRNAKKNFSYLFSKVSECDYYMFCDQDDVWDKNKIMYMLYEIKKYEKDDMPVLAYCDSKVVNSNMDIINESLVDYSNKMLPKKKLVEHVLVENYFPGCAVLFNNSLKVKIKDIYEDCEMHDWWLTLVASLIGKIVFVDMPLHNYRQHENNTVGAHKNENTIIKIKRRIHKLFDFKKTHSTWIKYQETVLNQAEELSKRYYDYPNINVVIEFVKIMNTKSKIKRLIMLYNKNYIPKEMVRIFRLVI